MTDQPPKQSLPSAVVTEALILARDAFVKYGMDVDADPPEQHRQMMAKIDAAIYLMKAKAPLPHGVDVEQLVSIVQAASAEDCEYGQRMISRSRARRIVEALGTKSEPESADLVERLTDYLYKREGGVAFESLSPADQEHWRNQGRELAAIVGTKSEDGSLTLDNGSAQWLMDRGLLHHTDEGWIAGDWPETNAPRTTNTEPTVGVSELKARIAELEDEVARWKANLRTTTNDHGLLACPKCDSLHDPYPYWWQRGQAWIIICSNCKHEEGRENTEGEARQVWNKAAEAGRALLSAERSGQ